MYNTGNVSNRSTPISPAFGMAQNLRGTRGSHLQCPRPQWPASPTPMNNIPMQPARPMQSPLTVNSAGPKPYRAPSFSPIPMYQQNTGLQPDNYYRSNTPLQPPSPAFELAPRYEYVGVPLEPPQLNQSYVIYDDEDENTPSTAEIIQLQSQDYVDEKLAQFEMMTIAKLQGKFILNYLISSILLHVKFCLKFHPSSLATEHG